MSPSLEKLIEQAAEALRRELGANLYSCCLYGSAVRGNYIEGQSDINLLISVGASTPDAHEKIARAIGNEAVIDPFVISQPALARTVRAFASKFASIQRNYRVIYGADPFAGLKIEPRHERFLCEQALRNLQLRMTFAFITRERNKSYRRFLARSVTPLFVQFSEALRLEGVAVPKEFEARIPLFEKQFNIDGMILRELLALKARPDERRRDTDADLHERVVPVVDSVLSWVVKHWEDE